MTSIEQLVALRKFLDNAQKFYAAGLGPDGKTQLNDTEKKELPAQFAKQQEKLEAAAKIYGLDTGKKSAAVNYYERKNFVWLGKDFNDGSKWNVSQRAAAGAIPAEPTAITDPETTLAVTSLPGNLPTIKDLMALKQKLDESKAFFDKGLGPDGKTALNDTEKKELPAQMDKAREELRKALVAHGVGTNQKSDHLTAFEHINSVRVQADGKVIDWSDVEINDYIKNGAPASLIPALDKKAKKIKAEKDAEETTARRNAEEAKAESARKARIDQYKKEEQQARNPSRGMGDMLDNLVTKAGGAVRAGINKMSPGMLKDTFNWFADAGGALYGFVKDTWNWFSPETKSIVLGVGGALMLGPWLSSFLTPLTSAIPGGSFIQALASLGIMGGTLAGISTMASNALSGPTPVAAQTVAHQYSTTDLQAAQAAANRGRVADRAPAPTAAGAGGGADAGAGAGGQEHDHDAPEEVGKGADGRIGISAVDAINPKTGLAGRALVTDDAETTTALNSFTHARTVAGQGNNKFGDLESAVGFTGGRHAEAEATVASLDYVSRSNPQRSTIQRILGTAQEWVPTPMGNQHDFAPAFG